MSGKRRNSTIDPKWEVNNLYNGQLSTSHCTKIVIIFQQHFVFNIEINGSVQLFQKIGTIIGSSNNSKWQACMRETDALGTVNQQMRWTRKIQRKAEGRRARFKNRYNRNRREPTRSHHRLDSEYQPTSSYSSTLKHFSSHHNQEEWGEGRKGRERNGTGRRRAPQPAQAAQPSRGCLTGQAPACSRSLQRGSDRWRQDAPGRQPAIQLTCQPWAALPREERGSGVVGRCGCLYWGWIFVSPSRLT